MRRYFLILILLLITWLWSGSAVWAQEVGVQATGETEEVQVDFSGYTFNDMPPLLENRQISSEWDETLGYELGRSCLSGESQADCTKLGDIQFLAPEQLTLSEIAEYSSVAYSLEDTALSTFGVIKNQSLGSLVEAIPKLKKLVAEDIPVIEDLLKSSGFSGSARNKTLENLLRSRSSLKSLSLSSLDLDQYSISDIPYLKDTKIEEFEGWQNTKVSETTGMAGMAWSGYKTLRNLSSIVALVDMPYGTSENRRYNTISGSYQEGFEVPCEKDCAHLELAGINEGDAVYGKQWISGKYQWVKGGEGPLGVAFGGKEPTGRFPFSLGKLGGFASKYASYEPKMVLWEIDETEGSVESRLFFRYCKYYPIYLGCTPYVLPPEGIPFVTYHEKDKIFVGLLDSSGGGSTAVALPEEYAEAIRETIPDENLSSITAPTPTFVEGEQGATLCGKTSQGLYYNSLADSFERIESYGDGKYQAIGVYDCADGLCGRALGRYQFMSFHDDLKDLIRSKPGGKEFLERVDT